MLRWCFFVMRVNFNFQFCSVCRARMFLGQLGHGSRMILVSCVRIDLLDRTNRPVQFAASKTQCFVQEVGSQIRAITAGHAAISLCP